MNRTWLSFCICREKRGNEGRSLSCGASRVCLGAGGAPVREGRKEGAEGQEGGGGGGCSRQEKGVKTFMKATSSRV